MSNDPYYFSQLTVTPNHSAFTTALLRGGASAGRPKQAPIFHFSDGFVGVSVFATPTVVAPLEVERGNGEGGGRRRKRRGKGGRAKKPPDTE